jgi:hypothetical protein
MLHSRPITGLFRFSLLGGLGLLAFAGSAAVATTPETAAEASLSNLIQTLVVDSIPRDFDNKKDWGKTKRVVNGLSLKNDGDGLKLREHKKEVNDGVWKEYHGTLVDPQQQFHVRLANLHAGAPGHTALQLVLTAQLHGDARVEQWKDGIRLLDATSDADCKLEVTLGCDVAWHWGPGGLLGELIVEPKVTSVDITLLEFRLNHVGKLGGWAAKELGEGLKGTVSHELHQQQPKLVEKINATIEKKKDRLHFSPDQALASGANKIQSLLHLGDSSAPAAAKDTAAVKSAPAR